jgi:outer membrane protein assembly factor BamE (lipoprotein component of BamABCDE complex)
MEKRGLSAAIAAFIFVTACSPTVATRGNLISDAKFKQVTAEKSTRADVVNAWGPPTAVSSFDQNTWYYIGETTAQKGIFAPEVRKRRIIRISFSPQNNDTVVAVADIDPKQGKDVDLVSRTTPTAGKDFTFVQQFIGNIGKYNPDTATKK